MSSSQGQSLDLRFGEPGATTAPKSNFTPKPLRARKQRGQDYDPSLTANMGPPDVVVAAGPSNKNIARQLPTTEKEKFDENSPRKLNYQKLREQIEDIRTLFNSTDRMSDLDANALAASWEHRLWNVSFGDSDQVSGYTKRIDAADKDLKKWTMNWGSAESNNSKEWTGQQFFVDYVQNHHASELQYKTKIESVTGLVSSEDRHRQALRKLLSYELETMKAILSPSHSLVNFDVAQIAQTWEEDNWTAACEKGKNVIEHVEYTEMECEEVHFWAEFRDGYPDEDVNMTGEARFSHFIRKHFDPKASDASSQHGDRQETKYSGDDESYVSEGDSDVGSVGSKEEYVDEEEGYARKKAHLKDSVAEFLPHYTKSPDDLIDRWHEKLLLLARSEGGGFKIYIDRLYDDMDIVEQCRDNWNRIVSKTGKTSHSLFSELVEDCSNEAITKLRRQVEEEEEERKHEILLNSEKFEESLNYHDKQRRAHRAESRLLISDVKLLMDSLHKLSHIDAAQLAAHWETLIWTQGPDYHAYLNKALDFEMDLLEWKNNWPSAVDNGKTGEENFVAYAHRNPDRSVLRCELRHVLDIISSTLLPDDPLANFYTQEAAESLEEDIWVIAEGSLDEQVRIIRDECRKLDRWYTQWTNVCEQGLTGEELFRQYYDQHFGEDHIPNGDPGDHGLDLETFNEAFDLACGNMASDDAEDDAGGNGLSDEFLENDGQELISPRSPKSYHSNDDDETDETVGRDTQDQADKQDATLSVFSGFPSTHSSDTKTAEPAQVSEPMQVDDPAQEQTINISHAKLASFNQLQVGNGISTSDVTTAADTYSLLRPIAPIVNHKTVGIKENTAMDGVAYHPLSGEVEMPDRDSTLPVQKQALDTTPARELATDPDTSMADTLMVDGDVSKVSDDNGKLPETFSTTATAIRDPTGFLVPYKQSSFWSTPQAFNQSASSLKKVSTPSSTVFRSKGFNFQRQTIKNSFNPFSLAMPAPGVPRIVLPSPTSPIKAIEEQPRQPFITATEVKSKTVSAKFIHEDGAEYSEDGPAKKPEVAGVKTMLIAPTVVAAPQATSAFTFKPLKGGFLPVIPSGFDAGSWSDGFDFRPLVEDNAANDASSPSEVGSTLETTEVQVSKIDKPFYEVAAEDNDRDALSSTPTGANVGATNVPEEIKEKSPVTEEESSSTSGVLSIMDKCLAKISSFTLHSVKTDAMNKEADKLEQAQAPQGTVEDAEEKYEEESEDDFEDVLEQKPIESKPKVTEMPKAQEENVSNQIQELAAAIQTSETYWLDANSDNTAPSAFIEVASEFHNIATNITNKALHNLEALSAKWQAFIDTIKAYINITTYFHPDYDYRLERISAQYRSDIEMMAEYEILSALPGAPDHWCNEANKRRKARDRKVEVMEDDMDKMRSLYQDYYDTLRVLRGNADAKVLETFADETLVGFYTKIVRVSEGFDLQDMGVSRTLSDPREYDGGVESVQKNGVDTKQRKALPLVVADDEEW
ncbi:hypothetical protein G6011_05833 [Alternaria panax]|uniref:Uncharacterized protein n=1 Tax=Alternaria panax TaxID=48097 RepID=A0AAD4FF79_9PLEO|nr:hypothetical protein G6011_05833 [Alternaria panax]